MPDTQERGFDAGVSAATDRPPDRPPHSTTRQQAISRTPSSATAAQERGPERCRRNSQGVEQRRRLLVSRPQRGDRGPSAHWSGAQVPLQVAATRPLCPGGPVRWPRRDRPVAVQQRVEQLEGLRRRGHRAGRAAPPPHRPPAATLNARCGPALRTPAPLGDRPAPSPRSPSRAAGSVQHQVRVALAPHAASPRPADTAAPRLALLGGPAGR